MAPQVKSESLGVFRWWVPEGGVSYLPKARDFANPTREHFGGLLVCSADVVDAESSSLRTRPYDPRREAPELLEELVRFDPNESGATLGPKLAAFATRRGFLATPQLTVDVGARVGAPAEPLAVWRQALAELREAWQLFGAVGTSDRAALEAMLRLDRRLGVAGLGRVEAAGSTRFPRATAGGAVNPIAQAAIRAGDVVAAGGFLLAAILSEKLATGSRLRVVWNAGTGRFERRAGYGSLIDYTWDAFAERFTGGAVVRVCPRCSGYFLVNERSRSGRDTYCGTACRVASHRKRAKARALLAEGRSVPSIARTVGYPPATVREWLASAPAATPKRVKRLSP